MSDFFDRFIADLVKGAEASEGFVRGSRPSVQISRENRGHEEKIASSGGPLAGMYEKGANDALRVFAKEAAGVFEGLVSTAAGAAAPHLLNKVAPKAMAAMRPVTRAVAEGTAGTLATEATNRVVDRFGKKPKQPGQQPAY